MIKALPIPLLIFVLGLLLMGCSEKSTEIDWVYPNGNHKALIMSYDDGLDDDIALAQLFDRYGIIGTFHLNSGLLDTRAIWYQGKPNEFLGTYLSKDTLLYVFKNHEIAVHGTYHKALVGLSDEEILEEINVDIENLTILSDRKISSMAYAFGSTNDHVAEVIGTTPLTNARTVKPSYNFELPQDYYLWNPTCHDSEALEYLEAYLSLDSPSLSLFYVWGHSWELRDTLRNQNILKFCNEIGDRDDIWYTGAGDFADYHASLKVLEIGPQQIVNPEGNGVVYYREKGQLKSLNPGQRLTH
ncbi:polysaccharide deacetylase family protein [Cyclobacteriaceae bacterium]|nr:polysaccharide deacetylase family protein [Cyclobacteriaceae bacterium]MDC1517173.1 polysaccharide deacetylase family protein [Cyclobacteriaceae bacterium]